MLFYSRYTYAVQRVVFRIELFDLGISLKIKERFHEIVLINFVFFNTAGSDDKREAPPWHPLYPWCVLR